MAHGKNLFTDKLILSLHSGKNTHVLKSLTDSLTYNKELHGIGLNKQNITRVV
jgi:hypothetical protein